MSNGLMTDRRFWPLFWTQFFGAFNDNVFKNALVILITFKSYSLMDLGNDQMVALCGGIFIFPFFLFSAFAGQIADKWPKNKLIYYIKIWEVIVMALGSVGFFLNSLPLLLVSLFLMGLQSTFFGPIKYSILPELTEEKELVEGNSLIEMGTFLAILLGTILGGLLIGIEGKGPHIVSIVVLCLAGIGVMFATKVQDLKPSNADLKIEYGLIKPTWNILKICRKYKGVWNSILAISWFWFLGAAILSIFPVYVKDTLGANESVVTLFLALFSIGVAAGSIVCEKLSKDGLELGLVPFGAIGISIFIFDLFLVGGTAPDLLYEIAPLDLKSFLKVVAHWRIIFDLFFFSFFSGIFIVPLYTYMQQYSDASSRSRVIAGNNIINALFMVVASILLTYFYSLGLTPVDIFLIFAFMNLVVAIYIFFVVPEFLLRFYVMIMGRIFYKTSVKNLHHIPSEGAAVLTCNHVSFIDWFIISALVKRPIRFVMHYSFMNIPVIKYFFKIAKVIPIAGFTENRKILDRSFEIISEELKEGEIVCIFPEGEITRDGNLVKFKKGIEKIISNDPVPVIPMTLQGLWGSFFSRKFGSAASKPSKLLTEFRTKVVLSAGTPIEPENVSAAKLEEVTQNLLKS